MKNLLTALFVLIFAGYCQAEGTVTVHGEGTSFAVPDVLYINLGVLTDGATASKALANNKEAMTNIFKTLKEAKVDDKDICSANFSLSPNYKHTKDDTVLVGYSVGNDVTVTVRDLDKIGTLLEALTKEGHANRISGVSFDVIDKKKYLKEARSAAVADALEKAKDFAKDAGVTLDKVLIIDEGHDLSPRSYSTQDSSRNTLAKGDKKFKVGVRVVFSIKN